VGYLCEQGDAFLQRSSGLVHLSGECLGGVEIVERNREREGRPFSPCVRDVLAVQGEGSAVISFYGHEPGQCRARAALRLLVPGAVEQVHCLLEQPPRLAVTPPTVRRDHTERAQRGAGAEPVGGPTG